MSRKTRVSSTTNNGGKLTALLLVASSIVIGAVIILIMSVLTRPSIDTLPESRDIFTLYDTYSMTVVVVFDEEPPIVQFMDPDGYMVDMVNIRYRPGSNFIQFFLPNAIPGVWRMAYDPLTNTEISTPYSVYMKHIFIRNFAIQVEQGEIGYMYVSFEVSADEPGEFNYELYAVFTAYDNSIADEILLVQGHGMLNENLVLGADTQEFQYMGGFMLRLTVYVQHGQAAIRDSAWLDLRLKQWDNGNF